jgi:hypothetical protein
MAYVLAAGVFAAIILAIGLFRAVVMTGHSPASGQYVTPTVLARIKTEYRDAD